MLNKLQKLTTSYKKILIISISIIILLLILLLLFNKFYDFTKLSWNMESDAKLTFTTPTTLNLSVIAYDKKKIPITNITFKTKDGKIEVDGQNVKWKVPNTPGEYTITASIFNGKTIKKTIKVINLEDNILLDGMFEILEDENADNDEDGLINSLEKTLGTNPNNADTDSDGLSDYIEINETKTDPLKIDSDDDGLNDGDELDLGLNPLKIVSFDDGIKDSDRILSYTVNSKDLGVSIEIKGKGNIASSTIDIIKNSTFTNINGFLDNVYNFYTKGIIEKATVKIKYNLLDVLAKNLNEDSLTLYCYDEKTKNLETIQTIVDKKNQLIIANLDYFSKYIIGDSNIVTNNKIGNDTNIMFIIDNSLSMYDNNITDTKGNDTDFKRLTLTNKMINVLTGNYKYGIAEFSGNYVNLNPFTSSKKEATEAINGMKNKRNSNNQGTNIVGALEKGITEFSLKEKDNNYLILLTDGENNIGSLSSTKNSLIEMAKINKTKICVIGLGKMVDKEILNEIAEATKCRFYNVTDVEALDEIYSLIVTNIDYNLIDTDNDEIVDGTIIADSGFLLKQDGFSFKNFSSYKSPKGNCYGMALFAMLYYKNELPIKLLGLNNSRWGIKEDLSSNGYDLTNTYFATNNRLYDYRIKNDNLNIFLDRPLDYMDKIDNNTFMIKKDYYDKLSNIGFRFVVDSSDKKDNFKYQRALLDIDSKKFNNNVNNEEVELMKAIWRLHITQINSKNIYFAKNPDKAFNELKQNLTNKNPIVSTISNKHAVNAIRLIQDNTNPNEFKIEVYDNNINYMTKYIEVIRTKYSKFQLNYTAWTNEYNYKFKYDFNNNLLENVTVGLSYSNTNN